VSRIAFLAKCFLTVLAKQSKQLSLTLIKTRDLIYNTRDFLPQCAIYFSAMQNVTKLGDNVYGDVDKKPSWRSGSF